MRQFSFNIKFAVALAVCLCLWMLTGVVTNQRAKNVEKAAQSDPSTFSVRAEIIRAVNYQPRIFVRGRTEAKRSVLVAAQVDGQLIETPANEGQLVEHGAPLCILDPEDRNLQLQQALALREKARIDYEGAVKLKGGGLQSQTQIAAAKASLALAEAQVKAATVASENLVVRAPFAGVLQERLADAGAFLTRGAPCAQLIQLSPLVVSGNVAEADLSFLSVGAAANVILLDKTEHTGVVSYVSHAADPLTRTFKVEIEIPNQDLRLADGLSAEVMILSAPRPAHLIAPSLLSLLDEGKIGVKILNDKNVVLVEQVSLLGDSPDGVWVSGLPEIARVISVGQEYVSEGNTVRVTEQKQTPSTTGSGAVAKDMGAKVELNKEGGSL